MYLSISPDQLASAGAYVSREWGDYGYRLEEVASPTHAVSLFTWCAGDGARFTVAVDRWSNCRTVPEGTDDAGLVQLVREMHTKATTA